MSKFDAIDLTKLPSPDVVETLDYEARLAARKARMRVALAAILPDWDPSLESDPIVKQLEEATYYEVLVRQRVNDAARAVMLAHATGADLDNLAANVNVARLLIDAGDPTARPPREAVWEDDTRLRGRAQMAFEGLSTAGPIGSYVYHALSASPHVADVGVISPVPGDVVVTILSDQGDGVPTADLLATVRAALTAEDVRPLTDRVTIRAGERLAYTVSATLEIYDGPDAQVVLATSRASVAAFTAGQRRLGEPVTIDGLHKSLRVAGVRRVTLTAPAASIDTAASQFPGCDGITVELAP